MKIVKLTPKFKAYRLGFTHGIRFDNYGSSKSLCKLQEMHGHQGPHSNWYVVYGPRDRKTRNYLSWIYLRNEADVTLLQLAGTLYDS
jgi:hypothetical protein